MRDTAADCIQVRAESGDVTTLGLRAAEKVMVSPGGPAAG
jgi:hypothetical protein